MEIDLKSLHPLEIKVLRLTLHTSDVKLLHREHVKKTTQASSKEELFPPELVKEANRVFNNFLPKLATNINRYVDNVQNSYW